MNSNETAFEIFKQDVYKFLWGHIAELKGDIIPLLDINQINECLAILIEYGQDIVWGSFDSQKECNFLSNLSNLLVLLHKEKDIRDEYHKNN